MAKSVLELAVGTGQWDAGLKKAKSALDNFTQANGGLQKALATDSDKMQQFVKMMGQMDSTAKTAKGQMNDYKGTIEQLTMQYNRMTDAQKAAVGPAYLQAIDQMKQKYQGVAQEVAKINQELKQTNEMSAGTGSGGGGLFGGDKLSGMLQVFGGNLMTKGAGMLAGLATEMGDMVKQGIELAKQGEGIRIAFQRLGRGDILDGLRQATHGTVTDLELMKAAVKFNDFKLPLEELGTMLAFAQQKAKDTGQSVDYMVDSIVTGLGRKSLMILDNLGLSAAQIKDKMAETGDMTKAVGAIIREEMAKAGDYVETAADRATQANVQLENAMTRLGETFQPLTDTANSMWTSIKIGALDLLNNAVKPLIKALQEAGALGQKARGNAGYENLGGDAKINRLIANLGDGKSPKAYRTYKAQMAEFDRYANSLKFKIASYGDDKSGIAQSAVAKLQTELAGVLTMRMEYDRRAQELHKKATTKNIEDNKEEEQSIDSLKKKLAELQEQRKKAIAAGDNDLSKNLLNQINQTKADIKGLGGSVTTKTSTGKTLEEKIEWDPNKANLAATKAIDTMPSVWKMMGGDEGLRKMMGIDKQQVDINRVLKEYVSDPDKEKRDKANKNEKDLVKNLSTLTSGISTLTSGIKGLGIGLPKEVDDVIGIISSLTSIIQGVQTIISIFSNTAMAANTAAIIANTAALTANSVANLIPLAHGGIVPHAANGYYVPGTHASGDVTPILANAGELVLNKSSQNNLANDLKGAEALVQTIDRYQTSIMRGSQYNYGTPTIGGGMLGNMKLETMITGEQIRLVLNNNGRRTGRGEYITTNFK